MKIHRTFAPRRRFLGATLAVLSTLGLTGPRKRQNWPDRPIKLLVPFAAGGNIDVTGRLMAARLSEALGQQMVVENRVGGGGIIAMEAVARRAGRLHAVVGEHQCHGHRAGHDQGEIRPGQGLRPDQRAGFKPAGAAGQRQGAGQDRRRIRRLREGAARSRSPMAAAADPGSASNLIMALFLNRADLKMTSVSYRGTAPALTDVIGGSYPATFVPISEAVAQATNPNIRILAVSSGKRSARLPDVPSIAETYPGYNAVSWTGMLAPAGTPKPIIDKLAGEMVRAGQGSEIRRAASRTTASIRPSKARRNLPP